MSIKQTHIEHWTITMWFERENEINTGKNKESDRKKNGKSFVIEMVNSCIMVGYWNSKRKSYVDELYHTNIMIVIVFMFPLDLKHTHTYTYIRMHARTYLSNDCWCEDFNLMPAFLRRFRDFCSLQLIDNSEIIQIESVVRHILVRSPIQHSPSFVMIKWACTYFNCFDTRNYLFLCRI